MTRKRKQPKVKQVPPSLEERGTPVGSPFAAEPAAEADLGIRPKTGFPIVGIGASAGGLAAFEAFFSGMPAETDSGMAFVLVQHLAPDHKSMLTDLVKRYTKMQVFEVEDGMAVQPNCAYIIPPNRDTEHDGMPRSAIATGLVDFVLPPAEMPAQLTAYVAHAFDQPVWRHSLPPRPHRSIPGTGAG